METTFKKVHLISLVASICFVSLMIILKMLLLDYCQFQYRFVVFALIGTLFGNIGAISLGVAINKYEKTKKLKSILSLVLVVLSFILTCFY